MSDQERREVELRWKEDEAAAHEHGDDSHHQQVVTEDLADDQDEDAERRRERADGVSAGRPHTPEPTRAVSSSAGGPGIRRRSLASPLSQVSNHALMRGDVETISPYKDDAAALSNHSVHEQLQRLSVQLSTVLALTTRLEAQHAAAQSRSRARSRISKASFETRNTRSGRRPSAPPPTASTPSGAEY
jgi:hypothetical protein